MGALCRICRAEIDARARRYSLIAGVVVTVPVAITVLSDLPDDQTARTVAIVGVVVCFVLVNVIVRRVVREMQ